MTRITLPYPPSANLYWRFNRGRIHRSQDAEQYIHVVGLICQVDAITPATGRVAVHVDVYRPARRGDLDNSLKVLLDSLRGYAYLDDSQITEIHAMRHDDKLTPRVEVEIVAL